MKVLGLVGAQMLNQDGTGLRTGGFLSPIYSDGCDAASLRRVSAGDPCVQFLIFYYDTYEYGTTHTVLITGTESFPDPGICLTTTLSPQPLPSEQKSS